MREQFQADPAEATQAAISMGISAFNGVFALAAAMAARGLLSKDNVEYMHVNMLEPLNNAGAMPEMMALQAKRIDEICSILSVEIENLNKQG